MGDFIIPELGQLANQQVRFAPSAVRVQQLANTRTLLDEILPDKQYPYQFVCYRMTDYRPDNHVDLVIHGRDLQHDLALMVKKFERSLPPVPVELAAEPMLTLDEVSRLFNVSTKTITRWRYRGLDCRYVLRDGKRQLGFPKSAVEQFANTHADRVQRGARFSHISMTEKDAIVREARELAGRGENLTEVSRIIAGRIGRSTEAVRYTIKDFDRNNPDAALFPQRTGPLSETMKRAIYDEFQEGKPVDLIAKRYKRTPSNLYRIINEERADRHILQPVDYIHNEEFEDQSRHDEFVGPMPDEEAFMAKVKSMRAPKEVDANMTYLYERPLLNFKQEQHLFRKFNYLKHCLHKLQLKLNPGKTRAQDLKKIEQLEAQIIATRDILIECNLRLVHKLASQHLQSGQSLDELKSDAHISIMRAVEKFDYGRGFKFSTYATWAIVKNFARSIPDENNHRNRYMTGSDEMLDHKMDDHTDESEQVAIAEQAKKRIQGLLQHLDKRTRDVIRMRTGIDGSSEMTLEQIGQHFGITKERVRQINVRGMKQLRERAALEGVEDAI